MLGAINHVAVSVVNLEESDRFWKPLMNFLGYQRTLNTDKLSVWQSKSTGSAINFWKAKENTKYKYYAPGLHHIAFNANKREQIDTFFVLLQELNIEILDSPKQYDCYESGYYAVYFEDINGFKIELAYTPSTRGETA